MNQTGLRIASQGALIQCPHCEKRILDGNVLLARVVVIGPRESKAKCPRCKTMVSVPLVFAVASAPHALPVAAPKTGT